MGMYKLVKEFCSFVVNLAFGEEGTDGGIWGLGTRRRTEAMVRSGRRWRSGCHGTCRRRKSGVGCLSAISG
jgi:hypothetical protein